MWLLLLALTVPPDDSFQAFHEEDGITVTLSPQKEGPPWVRGVGEVSATPEKIAAVLTRYETWPELFEGTVKATTVLEKQDQAARVHVVYPFPWPFRDRDAVIKYQLEKISTTLLRLWWRDDSKDGDPQTGVRIPKVEGETRLETVSPGKSKVRFSYLGELGATLNEGTKRKVWREEPLRYLRSLRKATAKTGAQ